MLDTPPTTNTWTRISKKLIELDPRTGLMAVVLVATVPLIIISVNHGLKRRQLDKNNISSQVELLARIAKNSQQRFVEKTKRTLEDVIDENENLLAAKDPVICNKMIGNIATNNFEYLNIAIADTNGDVFCSALPIDLQDEKVNIKDRYFFQKVVDNKGALPVGLSAGMSETQLGSATSGCAVTTSGCAVTATACLNLTTPLVKYLKTIPVDPSLAATSTTTNYSVVVDANGIVTVKACGTEGNTYISASR